MTPRDTGAGRPSGPLRASRDTVPITDRASSRPHTDPDPGAGAGPDAGRSSGTDRSPEADRPSDTGSTRTPSGTTGARAVRTDGGTSQSFATGVLDGWVRPAERFSIATAIAVLVPTTGIVYSESLLYADSLRPALFGYVVTLLFCTLAPLRYDGETTIFGAFALVPVFRLANLGMPTFFDVTLLWLPLIYGPLVVAVFIVARSRMPALSAGWKWAVIGAPVGVPLAYVMATIEYDIIQPPALVPTLEPFQVLAIAGVMIGYVALLEEMLFRGVLQRVLERRMGRILGLLLTSALFGVMHSGYALPEELAFAAAIGLVFGVIYDMTDSLALVTLMHGTLNVFLYAVIPLQGALIDVPI